MKKKVLSVLLCVGMIASLAAGCGGKKADDGGSGSDSKDSGKKLVYWSMWESSEPQGMVIQEAIKRYEKETGVKVDVQFKGRTGQREGLEPALNGGQTIDVFDEDVNRVNGTWGSYIMDLEDLAKDYEEKYGNETLFQIARNAGGGTLKSIPYQPSIFGFMYNKALFDKAGVTEAPKTWAEFDAVCQKLKDAGITPITADDAYMTCFSGYHLARYVGQDRVKEIVKNGEWDDPAVLKMAQDLEGFAKKGYFTENIASNVFPAGQNTEFAVGEAAIVIDGTWLPNEIKDTAAEDFEYGYFNYPTIDGGKDDNTANNIANQVLAINKDSKMSEEAMEFITYLTTGESDIAFTEDALCIPADKNNADKWPKQLELAKEGFDATTSFYDWACGIEENANVTPAIKEGTQKLLGGTIDAQGFVDEMKAAGK